ncbi:paladin isoform X1 [Macadamia integrifolia]|uniref:paladin isoform X1 n=2 Tax=Macadamia integrifolia TaxID=60698 RepID=UPI001C4E423B|nr:paladin isoform X1 [Macadamia integrifolia]XP_042502205.1 paladin isoform X1 [Macadamia integrifolia]
MSVQKEPEQVMKQRVGSVLGKKTILKSDHFPGCQNKRLAPQIDGAPNYRQADSLRVHGVAIPTIDGIRNVLNHIGGQQKGKQTRVLWHNLREEPVVYINGRPFVLRDVERPFSNLEYTGINRARVEQMEARLKDDILLEAARYGNKILVTDELPDGQMVDQWEPVTHDSVKTPLEVYEELQVEGYLVNYERVPITDEKSPKEQDFDILVHRILQTDINTEIVFNCQMGRGRTTTGMVIATLVYLNRTGASGIPRTTSIGKVFDAGPNVTDNLPNSEEAIRRGEYAVIRSLIRVLEGGVEGKRQVDKVIDRCASMQNLREAIATYRSSILRQPDEMKREASLSFFVEYLERYYFLICFAVYIHTEIASLLSSASGQSSFAYWMRARPELYSILRRLLRRDPMGALGYSSLKPSLMKIAESADGRPSEMGVVAALRNGEVLGSQTVLKSDHCPGCQNLSLPERVEGAPNFREVPGFPVYGVANPTIDGIRAVIQRVGSFKGGRPVFWHNMREEPVIYINGKPFVLREVERPYKNMLEYTGIDRERVERMEARLKEDILRESERYGGAIMVIHETNDGQIFDAWEHVNCGSIQTPLEVYRCLEAEGLPIKYARVPITDGKAPKSSDFNTLALNIASATKDTALVFNCQMGRGRTTTGTVIACLLRLRIDYGRPIIMQPLAAACEDVDSGSSSGEDAGDNSTESASNIITIKKEKDPNRAFGINDILLLRKITRLFDNGVECREALDAIIDRCSALQNIRQAVLHYRKVFNQQHVEPRVRRVALNRGAEYLERYFRLIAFAAYLGSDAFGSFCGQGDSRMTFKNWLHQRPEVQAMKWSIRLRPGRFFTVPEELRAPHESQHCDALMEAMVKDRTGSVLGKGSILKMYFFPGQRTSSRIQIHGAPHVYKVDRYPVYSMATPTISGAREMLTYLRAKSTASEKVSQKVIITDLREEAVVYVDGTPFVLRELNQPVDTLKHVGITGSVVEHMEARLKEDILAEVTQSGGRILLHREEHSLTLDQASVIGYWENILADNVKTPAEVYGALKDEGFNIEYRRIPLTREREALASDVDAIQYCKDESAGCYLFVSHTGFGGVAYAMAIICLRLNAEGPFVSEMSEPLASMAKDNLQTWACNEEAHKEGDYRDILNLTRVLMYGPKSKAEVDLVIERCAGAGNLRDDILYYRQELEKCTDGDDEKGACLMDMGIKALRRYFFLITFRSYLYCTSAREMGFLAWIEARPELGHLCHNLRID